MRCACARTPRLPRARPAIHENGSAGARIRAARRGHGIPPDSRGPFRNLSRPATDPRSSSRRPRKEGLARLPRQTESAPTRSCRSSPPQTPHHPVETLSGLTYGAAPPWTLRRGDNETQSEGALDGSRARILRRNVNNLEKRPVAYEHGIDDAARKRCRANKAGREARRRWKAFQSSRRDVRVLSRPTPRAGPLRPEESIGTRWVNLQGSPISTTGGANGREMVRALPAAQRSTTAHSLGW